MMSSVINEIEQQMQVHLSNDQMRQLHQVLESCLVKAEEANEQADLVQLFLAAKRVEGCSDKTIKYYDSTIRNALEKINKEIILISTDDLRIYLDDYQVKSNISSDCFFLPKHLEMLINSRVSG